ncbi:hypothetical protein KKH24_03010, partial [Patescibacteria group bacterium]|nr:hypothetical protein [Patescibacteria group bacterium]
ENEWTCQVDVETKAETEYESTLDAMIENGVQVYFVNDEQFQEMTKLGFEKVDILKKLQSENQLRGVNVLSFVQ